MIKTSKKSKPIVLGKNTQQVTPRQQMPMKAKVKILLVSQLMTVKKETMELACEELINNGYRPIVSNNAMIVFVKAVPDEAKMKAMLKAQKLLKTQKNKK